MKNRTQHYSFKKFIISIVWIYALLLSGLSFTFAQDKNQTSSNAKFDNNQPKFAMLVGIKNYKNKSIPSIEGCENNVPLLAETLEKDYGFKNENILTLMNEKATKEAIKENFKSHLTDNAKKAKADGKEAVIVYYFCGHGSQYADQDNDEDDEKDETFVAYDSRTGDVFDLLDDEIDDLKVELREFTSNTTLIFEACNSGTGSRNGFEKSNYIAQEIGADKRKRQPYKRKYQATQDTDYLTYTEISASMSDRKSLSESEESCNCKKPYSLMTKALVEGLKRATYTTTYRGLIKEVSTEVATQSQQSPQVDGNRDAILFGGAAKRAKPYIEIKEIKSADEIVIQAGVIHGLKVGSQVSVYSSESIENSGDKHWLSNGIVTKVGNVVASVKLPKDNPKTKKLTITSHVVLASPVFGGGSVILLLDQDKSKKNSVKKNNESNLLKDIEKRLSSEDLIKRKIVKIVDSEKRLNKQKESATAFIRLRKGKVKDIFSGNNEINPLQDKLTFCEGDELKKYTEKDLYPTDEQEVYYLDEGEFGGTPLFGNTYNPNDKDIAKKIANTIRDFAYQKNLRGLDNNASKLSEQFDVSLEYIPSEGIMETCNEGKSKHSLVKGKYRVKKISDNKIPTNTFYNLNIKNKSGEEARKTDEFASGESFYISVLNLNNKGKISVIRSGLQTKLGDDKETKITLKTTDPVGIERFIIVFSKEKVDFSFYETKGNSRTSKHILETLLTQSGQKTRNGRTVIKQEPNQWDVIHLELNIVGNI